MMQRLRFWWAYWISAHVGTHRARPAYVALPAEHVGATDDYAVELEAIVEEIEAERNGDRPPLPLTGDLTDAEREATVAAIQSATTEVPILDPLIMLERDTQRWFDEAWHGIVEEFDTEFVGVVYALVDDEETRAKLLHLARCQRDEFAMTIEMPVIRESVAA
jgi:hypothetical protein